ncbi:putative hydrolase [Escherichia coli]|uniref:Putative hydrolase n=1 Tax=Escherichia coli TaxID=562 RepID=A0A376W1Y8_ECOLX|nr:putative hydrolase [Escherichia coli]
MYQHHNWQGALLDYPVSKVVCVAVTMPNILKRWAAQYRRASAVY